MKPMKIRHALLVPACLWTLAAAAGAPDGADPARLLDGWSLRGSNTVRLERYDTDGPPAASPYRFGGTHSYDELHLDLAREASPWDRWRIQASGLLDHSAYRSPERGVVPERLALTRERGDAPLPYRLEVGDYLGYFSYRTLQRSLKGAQLELQPPSAGPWRSSLVLLLGEDQPYWKKLQLRDNLSAGLSWLAERPGQAAFGLNLVRNLRQADPGSGALRRVQTVLSAVTRLEARLGGAPLTVEGELAHLSGDHDGLAGATSGQDRSDNGLYLQVSGATGSPFTYRFRYERYGQDFRPAGAVITPDRRAFEAHVGYRLESGLALRARLLGYRDGLETANPTDTETRGFELSGPLLAGRVEGLSGRLDFFHQELGDLSRSVDLDTDNLALSLRKRLARGMTGRLDALYRSVDDDTGGGASVITRELALGLDAPLAAAGWRATVSPELRLRAITGSASDGGELIPRLALVARRGRHRAGLDLSYHIQNRDRAGSTDLATLEIGLRYGYTRGADTVGAELSRFDRNADPGADTDALRVSLFWTHAFDRPARAVVPSAAALPAAARPAPGGVGLLADLAPGVAIAEAERALRLAGIGGFSAAGPGVRVYEVRLLAEIERRQRLVVVEEAGAVERSALIIDLEATGTRESSEQIYERVRQGLRAAFGRPSSFFERGEFTVPLAAALDSGRFVRISEWDLPEGVLRLGIPRRLDRTARIEIQFARGFPEPQRSDWSLEVVR